MRKCWSEIKEAWSLLGKLDQYFIGMGLMLLVAGAFFERMPEVGFSVVGFCADLFSAVGTGFLVAGLIAYSKAMHQVKHKDA